MSTENESPLDRLWQEYGEAFGRFDDLTLARWMSQTLGQLKGQAWRFSHPLVGTYRLAAQTAHDRQVWLKRLATAPVTYVEAECCRAPLLPLLTRDIVDSGLICQHCSATAVQFEDLPDDLRTKLKAWAAEYGPVHEVAHWDDAKRRGVRNYDHEYENAAKRAEVLLARLGTDLAPLLLDLYPAVIWEDQDECLEVRPEDIAL